MLTLRYIQAIDRDAIISIHKQSIYGMCGDYYTEKEMKAWTDRLTPALFDEAMKDKNNVGIVAVEENTVIGYGFFNVQGRELRALYVLPRHTNRGVGKRLMVLLEEISREKNINELVLQSTINAVGFYRSLGYREIKTERHPVSEDISVACVRMEKELRGAGR